MPADVQTCPTHGFFEGESCPACGAAGRHVLDGGRRRRLSKYVSGALRHFPDDAGLELDAAGWTPFSDLVDSVERKYGWASRGALAAVVETDPKERFERDRRDEGGRIRAAYGHSVDVTLDSDDDAVPETLYHGTAARNLDAIRAEGLRPMNRQQVHLSESRADALEVGRRHGEDPVVLEIDAAALQDDGHDVTQRGQAVFTTDRVRPTYLSRVDGDDP